jgi:light-regulated signal transduction histidine kinase (bacteriophytochrome)
MQNVLHRKTFDIFSDLNWKDNKTLICNISRERINDLDMWKKHRKSMTVIVYDNKNLHITELEEARPVFILFYFIY